MTRAAYEEDGAVGRGLVLDVQTAFGLGIDRPRRGDDEAGLDETRGQRVPGAGRLVREHQRHYAVGLQNPPALGEDGRHALLVVAPGQRSGARLARKAGRIGDRLVFLVGQLPAEQLRKDVAGSALEPDVEEVRQLGVHHVVVVRRIHDDGIDARVIDVVEAVARLAGDGDGRSRGRRRRSRFGHIEQIAGIAGGGGADQAHQFVDTLGGLL